MKRFLINILVFVSAFLIMDRLIYLYLQAVRPSDYEIFLESKKEFFKSPPDIDLLIIGDSHIADALDPRLLEKCAAIKSYNLGVYHTSPFENYFITKAAIKQLDQKPNVVVLGTNPVMFEQKLSKGRYTPLILKNNFELVVNSEKGFDVGFFLKTFQEKYLFKFILNKLKGQKYKPTREVIDVYMGHLKFYNQSENVEWSDFERQKELLINEKQIQYFTKTIEHLQSQNIEVILVNPPIWSKELNAISNTQSFIAFNEVLKRMRDDYSVEVYNPDFNILNKELMKSDFLNTQHLNYNGSLKFTKAFCDHLITEHEN